MNLRPRQLLIRYSIMTLIACIISACGPEQATAPGENASAELNSGAESSAVIADYIEKGDLPALQSRTVLRLIAPTFDEDTALVRSGLPVADYRRLAEQFATTLGLQAQWIYVDDFDQLLPTLNSGKGDMVVTNMSITRKRLSQAAFALPLIEIDEVLVTASNRKITDIEQINGLSVGVPLGTAYIDTLHKLQAKYQQLTIVEANSNLSSNEMLDALKKGEFDATVLDSNVASLLLDASDQFSTGPTLAKNRPISWGLRKNNPLLLQKLNEFFVSQHIRDASRDIAVRDWDKIKESRVLRMLTLNNPASYFMWRGDLRGFDYDLVKHFANKHELRLVVIVKKDIDSLFTALKNGEGDMVAASITATEERAAAGLVFSKRYLEVTEQLVGQVSANGDRSELTSIQALSGKTIVVNPQTSFYQRLNAIKADGVDLHIEERPGTTTEELIGAVLNGEFDYTLADSHLVAIEANYFDNLNIAMNFDKQNIAFAIRPDQPELLQQLNRYVGKNYRGLFFNVTYNKYFKNKRKMKILRKSRVIPDSDLSPFDAIVKEESAKEKLDWRLVTSQMYQESKFDPKAQSYAGAQGLMQVLPRTAQEFDYSDLYQPENGIKAGVTYMAWLRDRFPGELSLEQRIYFTLAAYNAGTGHVRDARRLASQLGKDPDQWFDNVEDAMLLLSKPQYSQAARFGYVRGSEPVSYVRKIRDRYLGYLQTHGN